MRRIILTVSLMIMAISAAAFVLAPKANAATTCPSGASIAYGRSQFCGYFDNNYKDNGGFVLSNGIPNSVNTTNEFINDILGDLSGSAQNTTGAEFIINTMLGNQGGVRPVRPTAAEITDWENRVHAYGGSENGNVSTGPSGTIEWFDTHTESCSSVNVFNSYYQAGGVGSGRANGGPNDDAFFKETKSSSPPCGTTDTYISFYSTSGKLVYQLRRLCGNPKGDFGGLPKAPPPYTLTPKVTATVNGNPSNTAFIGQTVKFTYSVLDAGGASVATDCYTYDNYYAFNHTPTNPPDKGPAARNTVCSNKIFSANSTTGEGSFTVPAAKMISGDSVCSSLYVDPGSRNASGVLGGEVGAEACVYIPPPDTLVPTVNSSVNGGSSYTAQVGDTITFNYGVINNGGASAATECDTYNNIYAGFKATPAIPAMGPAAKNVICTNKIFASNSTTNLGSYTVPAGKIVTNETICSSLYVNPGSRNAQGVLGPAVGAESCVIIPALPYTRVFGGDVSAGNGQPPGGGTCMDNPNGSVISWNIGSNPYNGAGTQFATYAMDKIYDFATAQSSGANATPPSGLAFANVAPGANNYGGAFGAGWTNCIPDYYGTLANLSNVGTFDNAAATSLENGTLATGSYSSTNPATITGGQVGPGDSVQVFVKGNVYITHNITYNFGGGVPTDQLPMFELIVEGNIYIDKGVTQLDGTYIAQGSGPGGGVISTCADASGPLALDGSLDSACGAPLTVNGSFVADWIELMRTSGTVSGASGDNPSTLNSDAAEQFNYSPALWIAQPPEPTNLGTTPDYDSIVGLPPVL